MGSLVQTCRGQPICLEVDSKTMGMILELKVQSAPSILDIHNSLSAFSDCHITHIWREGNRLAVAVNGENEGRHRRRRRDHKKINVDGMGYFTDNLTGSN